MVALAACRRACAGPGVFSKLLRPLSRVRAAPSLARSFSTDIQRARDFDRDDADSGRGISARRDSPPSFFQDVFDPFLPSRSLSQLMNLVDQFAENPWAAASRGMGGAARRGWDVKESNEALFLRMDMPGLGKEDVDITIDQNTLIIKGGTEREGGEEWYGRYSSRIDLPLNLYKVDEIKAEIKNGVLRVVVPKVKEEERKDVVHVKID